MVNDIENDMQGLPTLRVILSLRYFILELLIYIIILHFIPHKIIYRSPYKLCSLISETNTA